MTDPKPIMELTPESSFWRMEFTADGEYLVTGDCKEIQMWRVRDQTRTVTALAPELVKRIPSMYADDVSLQVDRHTTRTCCLAMSRDGRRVAAGVQEFTKHHRPSGRLGVWDTETFEVVFRRDGVIYIDVISADLSPDATRLVTGGFGSATIWDIFQTWGRVLELNHSDNKGVELVKYSPQGDRIATISDGHLRVFNSKRGQLLLDVQKSDLAYFLYRPDLCWSGGDQLFFLYNGKIERLDASTGSILSAWEVPDHGVGSCVALPRHRRFVAFSSKNTVSLWDTSAPHSKLTEITEPGAIHLTALSLDGRLLAIKRLMRTSVVIYNVSHLAEKHILSYGVALDPGVFKFPESSLSMAFTAPQNPGYHALALRAFLRTHLRQWDDAIDDAHQSMAIQPSLISYIAKSVALVGKGDRIQAYRVYDLALLHFHPAHAVSFLLIKAIIMFMAGDHSDAILRVADLISMIPSNYVFYIVQAYMHLCFGDAQIQGGDSEGAIQSFECARARIRGHNTRALAIISLISGWKFNYLEIKIGRRLCEALYKADRMEAAVKCFVEMQGTFEKEAAVSKWVSDFKRRCCNKLESLGHNAMDAQFYEKAINHYSMALSLDPDSPQDFLIKRGKARMAGKLWDDALEDANEVITRDPSSPWGYELKHAILHGTKRYADAIDAFETMLSKISQSSDPDTRARRNQYISPASTREKIRTIAQRTIRHLPRMLINTSTGRLQSREEQRSTFESSAIFQELLSSMTMRIDGARIKREVKVFFRYVMLSHRWEDNEPLFQEVLHTAVYDLNESPTHEKLQTFCRIVQEAGVSWAWSDTCCIDKQDHFVHQEALVAMFKWYRNATLVIVYLRGVRSPAKLGDLVDSEWNKRGWTFQEYVAGKVARFYTEDWKQYLKLDIPNHKESPEIIVEMEKATGVSAERLMALQPGLSNIREKLCLASNRKTTLIEDAAYSLLGIFSVSGIPAIYGEGESALGRLLAHILSGSGDVSILAWTGQSSSLNSCLPAHITVYSQPATSHIPLHATDMEHAMIKLRQSRVSPDSAMRLYDCLTHLPTAWFAASRMKLLCIAFQISSFSLCRTRVYRANTAAFGVVEVKTRWNLSRVTSLYLVHPWMDALLGREHTHVNAPVEGETVGPLFPDEDGQEEEGDEMDQENVEEDEGGPSPPPGPSLPLPHSSRRAVPENKETRALQFIARLRQPFGALLLMQASTGGREEYRRIATDSLITVQIQESVSLEELLENVRTLDVL